MSGLDLERIVREHPEGATLWEGLAEGVLRLQRCSGCERARFLPLASCPYCAVTDFTVEEVEPRGTVYSWVVTHHPFDEALADELPYVIVTVTLDAGPRMFARLTGCAPDEIQAGMAVAGHPHTEGGVPFLRFEPA
jgi:uncharacterized OB-fold protein